MSWLTIKPRRNLPASMASRWPIAWTCTTATNVVQIAAAGGQNVMECGGTTCMVVQSAPANGSDHMKCEMHSSDPDALEECFVTQSSSHNFATVLMDANATGADTSGAQNANQHAYVHQDGSDNHSEAAGHRDATNASYKGRCMRASRANANLITLASHANVANVYIVATGGEVGACLGT